MTKEKVTVKIPNGWTSVQLNELLDLLTDFEANGSFADVKENVKVYDSPNYAWYVRATDLENNTPLSEVKYVDKKTYDFLKKAPLFGGELLITKRGEIGKVYFFKRVDVPATVAPNMYLLKFNEKAIPKYIYYYFISKHGNDKLKRINASATIGALYKDDVKELQLIVPPINEQNKIIEIISTWDNAIETLDALIKRKERFKKALMQQLLTGKKRFKEFKGEKWRKAPLKASVEDFIVPMRDKPKSLDGPIPWCRIEDFDGKYLSKSKSNQGVTLETIKAMNLKVYPIGTLLVSCSANLGICAITKDNLLTNQTFIGLVPKATTSVNFLYYQMICNAQNLNKLSSGTTISYLSREEFENFLIYTPPSKKEQEKIALTLSAIDDEIQILKKQWCNSRRQKKGLMQILLTGKKRVKV